MNRIANMPALRVRDAIAAVDERIGHLIETTNQNHHRRRLARAGWSRAFDEHDPPWAQAAFSARDGNELRVLVDGAAALPMVAKAIAEAQSYVHVAGWAITADFELQRTPHALTLRDALAEAAGHADVRVLVWAGAPVGVIHPTRAESSRALSDLVQGTRIRGALDRRNRPMHCHHEKVVIIDGRTAFVGGIDLTTFGGDRFDSSPHPQRAGLGWHDAAAQITGPAVADVAAHFAMRWQATTGEKAETPPPVAPAGHSRVQVLRTLPEGLYRALPNGDFSILEAYISLLKRARRLVYLENQFLWSSEIVAVLREKLLAPPSPEFRLCILLPRRPNNGNDDTRGQLGVLQEADREKRLLAGTVGPRRETGNAVYVHAKIGIVDDEWLTLGSANLNEHSLFNDTEVNVLTDDAALARTVREQLWSEHLGRECAGIDPLTVLEEHWRPLLMHETDGAALQPLPNVSRRSARLLGPLKGLAVDG